jgi:hypothetical protein
MWDLWSSAREPSAERRRRPTGHREGYPDLERRLESKNRTPRVSWVYTARMWVRRQAGRSPLKDATVQRAGVLAAELGGDLEPIRDQPVARHPPQAPRIGGRGVILWLYQCHARACARD